MTRPNLFLVGAMKSGTTSLHEYLARHPDIFMCEPKEPGYFVDQLNWDRGEAWYLSLFRNGAGRAYRGESSTHYTKRPTYEGVARRIAEFNPDARIVYVMRDPVKRALSHYWHNVNAMMDEAEHRDLIDAVRRNPEYVAFSDYAYQLEAYLEVFPKDHVYALTLEELIRNPRQQVDDLCRWLGLPPIPQDAPLGSAFNVQPPRIRRVRFFGLPNRLRRSALWDRVAFLFPKRLRARMNAVAETASDPKAVDTTEATRFLREALAPRVANLERLLGRSFPDWSVGSARALEAPRR